MNRPPPPPAAHPFAVPAALALAAALMLIPANLLPVIGTQTSGRFETNTIFTGIVELWRNGLWPIAAIVFIASLAIPCFKLAGLGWLLWHARGGATAHPRRLTRLYATLDFIGRWSMLDVFLVAFLTGLVRFGALSKVEPEMGIVAFAAAVVLTVLATQAFDPRLLWHAPAPADQADPSLP